MRIVTELQLQKHESDFQFSVPPQPCLVPPQPCSVPPQPCFSSTPTLFQFHPNLAPVNMYTYTGCHAVQPVS